jgi:hypothetical protein
LIHGTLNESLMLSTPPNPAVWVWGYQSVVRLLKVTAGGFGHRERRSRRDLSIHALIRLSEGNLVAGLFRKRKHALNWGAFTALLLALVIGNYSCYVFRRRGCR